MYEDVLDFAPRAESHELLNPKAQEHDFDHCAHFQANRLCTLQREVPES